MPLSAHLEPDESINMTPMIDVVFNLLVFFLLSATYITEERQLELQVPSVPASAPAVAAPSDLIINIAASGTISINNQELSVEAMEQRLESARKNFPGQGVSIRGDKQAAYQFVARVLSVCKRVGIRRIDVMVQEQK
ncbi:biopolymer transporter ExbD [bacterium]|jgi:biopolymer transport protein ExbD|nr:biopolymer transporter ExbD [bacterium]